MSNPFATSPFAAATETETTVTAETTVAADATTATVDTTAPTIAEDGSEVKVKKARKARVSTNRRKTQEEVRFILENYKDQSTSDIARKLGLTSQQVSRTILDARKAYLAKAETLPPEKAEAIRNWVETYLPSKVSEFGRGGGKRGTMVDNMFDDIFGSIL